MAGAHTEVCRRDAPPRNAEWRADLGRRLDELDLLKRLSSEALLRGCASRLPATEVEARINGVILAVGRLLHWVPGRCQAVAGFTITGARLEGADVEHDKKHWNHEQAVEWRADDERELSYLLTKVCEECNRCENMALLADGFSPSAPSQEPEADQPTQDDRTPPKWIHTYFPQQQFNLLRLLWKAGRHEAGMFNAIPADRLEKELGYTGSDPAGSLLKLKTRTNARLQEKADKIGGAWSIGQRDRGGKRFFYLEELGRTN